MRIRTAVWHAWMSCNVQKYCSVFLWCHHIGGRRGQIRNASSARMSSAHAEVFSRRKCAVNSLFVAAAAGVLTDVGANVGHMPVTAEMCGLELVEFKLMDICSDPDTSARCGYVIFDPRSPLLSNLALSAFYLIPWIMPIALLMPGEGC